MADPISRFLPATDKDWMQAQRGQSGELEYTRTNPAWTAQELQKALAERQALNELMQRQAPWTLNPALVGQGMPDNGPYTMQSIMRGLSSATIGQPYGFLSPPTTSDVAGADSRIRDAGIEDARANRDMSRLAELLMGRK